MRFIPVPVMIGASAIVATRCLEFILLFDAMGVAGVVDFVQASAESWVNCFILLASLLIVWIECHASYAMMRGRNWGRWAFVGCQAVVVSYMLLASFEWFGPKIFRFETETQGQFLHALLMQKVPDMVVLLLLFAPQSSRQFFLRRRAAFQAAR
ncbi:MAG: YbjO family protein [Ewingella americana]|uniref:YbjO family protein n=1 Tax=Ewingella americana TaxID=41202 RepID=UPI000C2FB297|nr:YbjO family protein [Ewingella americana]MCI1678687.1 YbjO family protein [Ewingella americana]MCI1854274.1 YbjO family protein [Ewingella americana]MCI1861574.1 YbjO family protein [Ewingella americana]MCI2140920.1 YbjO family protein [Ewingella americana]MCI2165135.1 YbjO family protein [Ewingella americana]